MTGKERDAESGNDYFGARYYNPQTGRFLSEDPTGFAGSGQNLYAYSGDDPIDFIDPFGLDKKAPNNILAWEKKNISCLLSSEKNNGVAIGLDETGIGLAFVPGASLAKSGVEAGVALASSFVGMAHGDMSGSLAGITGSVLAPVEMAETVGASWAKAIPFVGGVISAAALVNDASSAVSDYNGCMAGTQ